MCNNQYNSHKSFECSVFILSQGDGWKDEKNTKGKFSFDGERAKLSYTLDGDNCILTADNKTVTQIREGAHNISLTFCGGESSECTITANGLSGSFEIFTEEIKIAIEESAFKLSLKYISGNDREKIKLSLTAEKIGG